MEESLESPNSLESPDEGRILLYFPHSEGSLKSLESDSCTLGLQSSLMGDDLSLQRCNANAALKVPSYLCRPFSRRVSNAARFSKCRFSAELEKLELIFGKWIWTATFQFSESSGSLNGQDLFTELPFL